MIELLPKRTFDFCDPLVQNTQIGLKLKTRISFKSNQLQFNGDRKYMVCLDHCSTVNELSHTSGPLPKNLHTK